MHAAGVHVKHLFMLYTIAPFLNLFSFEWTQLLACMNFKKNSGFFFRYISYIATFYKHYKAINYYSYGTIHEEHKTHTVHTLKKVLQYRTIAFLFLSLIIRYGTIGHANVLHYIIQRYTKTALFNLVFFF